MERFLKLSLFLIFIGVVQFKSTTQELKDNITDCIIKSEDVFVRGDSLSSMIYNGQRVKLLQGYYKCNSVEREDVIAYRYAGNDAPVIKIVKAVPGDEWYLKKNKAGNRYQIIVNGESLRNSEDQLYQIPEYNSKTLQLYVKTYPKLRKDTYLILGNQVSGSADSTRFGLVDKSDIVGKIIFKRRGE
ncbi:MAG: signal peptidase I [Candidatus Omnitrophota bacterium]|nr:MAG: signal peptidase I [Candidatus Omnitrophota bacterium]